MLTEEEYKHLHGLLILLSRTKLFLWEYCGRGELRVMATSYRIANTLGLLLVHVINAAYALMQLNKAIATGRMRNVATSGVIIGGEFLYLITKASLTYFNFDSVQMSNQIVNISHGQGKQYMRLRQDFMFSKNTIKVKDCIMYNYVLYIII
jgi:hypothetical protein